ncbi:uncharacterized protein F4812DRAFT_423416 [Daldinia caldariorum]|uniref:uncharacterized protein n=1 Tax=Daldinia caldariorum TaxID=326644 RepID=UPI0020072D3F|nr:uncharacterized protein F4812DRAFT_423416 [Daldinia caldariorum]KAI1469510.1 hypothetical protein F4812DRAFT_423416 [Daldinia caldariorum]
MADFLPDLAEFPNTAQRRRQSVTRPDAMAEQSTTGTKPSITDSIDPDTCRICRGEGTVEEPLFYPCKCSGSIKYVHQDCLMEWLSHSQKKHCELCKTPFRFTKLYSPNMPKRLPFYIFVTHMAKYLFRNVLVWLRAVLVISVWLGWLPYLMRSVWSFLFWLSDEGFGPSPPILDFRNATSIGQGDLASLSVTGTTTCASTPLLPATTTAASIGHIIDQIPVSNLLRAISRPMSSSPPPWFSVILGLSPATDKSLYGVKDFLNVTHTDQFSISPAAYRPSSLLSDVAILKNFTRHPAINRIIIAVLEGQIITLLVIVCFILIILVRDYVVQQQPEINMRAAFAAAENEVPLPPGAVNGPLPFNMGQEDEEDIDSDEDSAAAADSSADENNAGDADANRVDRPQDAIDLQDPRNRPIAGFRRRAPRNDSQAGQEGMRGGRGMGESAVYDAALAEQHGRYRPGPTQQRPSTRTYAEDFGGESGSQGTVKEYLRIYREAGGDQERILEIIREEGLEDRMKYWVRVTQSMATAGKAANGSGVDLGNDGIGSSVLTHQEPRSSRSPTRPDSPRADATSSDNSSWTWAENDDRDALVSQGSSDKGKRKATETSGNDKDSWADSWASWGGEFGETTPFFAGGSGSGESASSSAVPSLARPRAASDGPRVSKPINMLANNNWSFSDLPSGPSNVSGKDVSGHHDPALPPPIFSGIDSDVHEPGTPQRNEPVEGNTAADQLQRPRDPTLTPQPVTTSGAMEDGAAGEADAQDSERDDPAEDFTGLIEPVHDNEPAVVAARQAGGIVDRVADFMWGDVDVGHVDDVEPEEAVDIFGDNQNAPFFDNDRGIDREDGNDIEMAPDVVEAAVAAGLDPEAVEDAEDFEGIMELIGMRGPVAGLFQNAIFCAFLVSISIFFCIFIPYNVGRVSVWIIAHPTRLLRIVFSASKFVQDAVLLTLGYTSTFIFTLAEAFAVLLRIDQGREIIHTLRIDTRHVALSALERILASFMSEIPLISVSEVRNFSAVSHEALMMIKSDIRYALSYIGHVVLYIFGGNYFAKLAAVKTVISASLPGTVQFLKSLPTTATQPGSWMLNLSLSEPSSSASPILSYWDANDRTWAILAGYISLSVIAGFYLARGTPFSTGQAAQEWEASFIDALNQASGVMKVILIISIEMLIFPLYCGLLLDFALLPLFEDTSIRSRLLFTYNYPLTSIFVHWFVGTGYMFHFALFVSMCRKIMRKGVLYFIRDPDDPEFHPVRDVLERNVTTQLRKILFSAFVYGALVVVCLGGVVWGLSLTLPNVLPIHYSSNEPVLEFPIDLLFYNFLMPLAVKFFRPSDGLHAMYTWWFRKCARGLRLTWFLFGERRVDEEGILVPPEDSPCRNFPWWRQMFLEVNDETRVVPKTWQDTFKGGKAKPSSKIPAEEMSVHNERKKKLVNSGQLIPDGRFVRSPASDQVKIPKGQPVFLDVTEEDRRRDGKPDRPDTDLYSGVHYQFVYVPPHFRARIFLFILFIWIFAAVTGVGFTIIPLVFGRRMFKILIPSHIRTNDIYAFSIGVYILGSLGYFVFHLRSTLGKLRTWTLSALDSVLDRHTMQRALQLTTHVSRLLYTYIVLLIVFPLLITLLVELYLLMPLHTYMYPAATDTTKRLDSLREGHTIRVIQAWTLGILYLKLGSRAVTLYGGRPAHAVRAVLRRGWLEPDIRVLTRAFVIPGLIISLVMIVMPPIMAWATLHHVLDVNTEVTQEMRVLIFRLAYPATALFWTGLVMMRRMLRVFEGWQVRIRDEAYLMGERLHNFGGTSSKVANWRGSGRL